MLRRTDRDERSVLCFRLGREWLGLGCERVLEVAPAHTPRRIAHRANGNVEGLVAVRGELHLSVALIEVLSLGHRDEIGGERSRLILMAPQSSPPIAFRASEVIGLRPIRLADIEEVPAALPPRLAHCLSGVAPFEQGRLSLLDADALLQSMDEAVYQ
jgi:chemotaxis signal transduction protein